MERPIQWGIGLMLIGTAFGGAANLLAGAYRPLLLVLCIVFFLAGLLLISWPYLRRQSNATLALHLRDQLQRLLDKVGEEPKINYRSSKDQFDKQLEIWRTHTLKLVHTFRRKLLPRIQDFIHHLGEQGITDEPLNLMIDNDPKDYAALKAIADRLTIIASRFRQDTGDSLLRRD